MGQRISGFLVVFLLMFSGKILGQVSVPIPKANAVLSIRSQPLPFRSKFSLPPALHYEDCTGPKGRFRLAGLPGSSFYARNLGFICRTELKLDKISPLPFRFRLGSLEYVNWMEGKPNAIRPK